MGVLDDKQRARFTMAVFNANHGAELVVVRPTLDGAKAECVYQLDLMLPLENRAEAFRSMCGWHYRIAHERHIVEEGDVGMLPNGRIVVR